MLHHQFDLDGAGLGMGSTDVECAGAPAVANRIEPDMSPNEEGFKVHELRKARDGFVDIGDMICHLHEMLARRCAR